MSNSSAPDTELATLVEGDAWPLLRVLRRDTWAAGLRVIERASLDAPARVVVLAVTCDDRHSALWEASRIFADLRDSLAHDAVGVVVVQERSSRIPRHRLQRLLADEILFQVAIGRAATSASVPRRSLRAFRGVGLLKAAGISILRIA